MDIQELIRQLLRAGDHPHPDLLAAILACREAAVAPLIAIISDPEMYGLLRRYTGDFLAAYRAQFGR